MRLSIGLNLYLVEHIVVEQRYFDSSWHFLIHDEMFIHDWEYYFNELENFEINL